MPHHLLLILYRIGPESERVEVLLVFSWTKEHFLGRSLHCPTINKIWLSDDLKVNTRDYCEMNWIIPANLSKASRPQCSK